MDLERSQGRHNEVIVGAGNVTPSLDPHEINKSVRKSVSSISNGAVIAAAAETLGLSEEETLRAISRKRSKQHINDESSESISQREAAFEQATNTLLSDSKFDTIDSEQGYTTVGRDDLTEEQIYQGLTDIEGGLRTQTGEQFRGGKYYAEEQDNSELREQERRGRAIFKRRDETGRMRAAPVREGGEIPLEYRRISPEERTNDTVTSFIKSATADDEPVRGSREAVSKGSPVTPNIALIQQAAQLDDALASGPRQGPPLPPEKAAQIERIKQRLLESVDPRAARARERQEVIKLIKADAATFDPEVRQQNDADAALEAAIINRQTGKFSGFGGSYATSADLAQLPNVSNLGSAKVPGPLGDITLAAQDPRTMPVAQQENSMTIAITEDGRVLPALENSYIDPRTGQNLSDPEFYLRGPNTPNSAQNANAPQLSTTATWIAENLPDFRASESSFGDYPQTDIALSTTNFAQKVRELSGFGTKDVPTDVRSVQDLDDMVRSVYEGAARKKIRKNGVTTVGQQLFTRDAEGNNVPAELNDPEGVMELLKMSSGEKADLANALFQVEMAQTQNARDYQNRTGTPAPTRVNMGTEVDNRGATKLVTVPKNSTVVVGTTPEGKPIRQNIRAAFNELEGGPSVTTPVIGAAIDPKTGEEERNAGRRYISRKRPRGMGEGQELEDNLRRQAMGRLRKGETLDEDRLRKNTTKAKLVLERQKRAERAEARKRELSRVRGKNVTGLQEEGQASPLRLPSRASEFTADRRGPMTEGERARLAESRKKPVINPRNYGTGAEEYMAEQALEKELQTRQMEDNKRSNAQNQVIADIRATSAPTPAPSQDPGVKQRAQTNENTRKKIMDILGRRDVRRGGIGAAAAGGAVLAGKGIYDVTRPEEEEMYR